MVCHNCHVQTVKAGFLGLKASPDADVWAYAARNGSPVRTAIRASAED